MLFVPRNRFGKTRIKIMLGFPPKLLFYLGPINCVFPIVSRPVFDKLNNRLIATHYMQYFLYYRKVIYILCKSSHTIRFTQLAFLDDHLNCPTMILNIKPIPYIFAVAVHRHSFSFENIGNCQRNKFFRKMKGSEIVRTVGYGYRQTIRM